MYQPLPYTEFQWIEDTVNFDVSSIVPDSFTGYILEVDLEYLQDTLTYLSAQRAINRPASAEINF